MTPGKAFHGASDVTVIGITGFLFTCTFPPHRGIKGAGIHTCTPAISQSGLSPVTTQVILEGQPPV